MSMTDLALAIDPRAPNSVDDPEFLIWLQDNFDRIKAILLLGNEVSGSFTSDEGKTITVVNGIITTITEPP